MRFAFNNHKLLTKGTLRMLESTYRYRVRESWWRISSATVL